MNDALNPVAPTTAGPAVKRRTCTRSVKEANAASTGNALSAPGPTEPTNIALPLQEATAACPAVQLDPASLAEPINDATLMDTSPQAMTHQRREVQYARAKRRGGTSLEANDQGNAADDTIEDPDGDSCHNDDPIEHPSEANVLVVSTFSRKLWRRRDCMRQRR
eukprot:7079781-Pyramimonas_sp.AAC.1